MRTLETTFPDRTEAGRRLAERLASYASLDPIVIALPRGGVPVAAEVARRLRAPLDVLIVRKIGCPWHPELGVGALAEGGIRVLHEQLIHDLGIEAAELEPIIERAQAEIERRARLYRGSEPALLLAGRVVIVVDDGLATGYTARAAIAALRHQGARRIALAVPVASPATIAEMGAIADEVVALLAPESLVAIGLFYDDFRQTTDDEVVALLAGARRSVVEQSAGPSRPTEVVGTRRTA